MPPIGRKNIFLPNFTVALLRTPHLPSNFAQFLVPLNINKLDMRDYLLHAYGVEVLSVRSFITQQKIQRTEVGFENSRATKWFRPRSVKKMTVELKQPFVYPPEPEDLSPWDNELFKALDKHREQIAKTQGPLSYKETKPGRASLRAMAEAEMAKVETREIEVEKDITIDR